MSINQLIKSQIVGSETTPTAVDESLSRKRPASPLSSEISEPPTKRTKVEAETQFLDLPSDVVQQIFTELGSRSCQSIACSKMRVIHNTLRIQQAWRLEDLDYSTHMLSNVGITFPRVFTALTVGNLFKRICQRVTLLSIVVLNDKVSQAKARELVLDPISLTSFFEKVGDIGQSMGLREITHLTVCRSLAESRNLLKEWLQTADLESVITSVLSKDPNTVASWKKQSVSLASVAAILDPFSEKAIEDQDPTQREAYRVLSAALKASFFTDENG